MRVIVSFILSVFLLTPLNAQAQGGTPTPTPVPTSTPYSNLPVRAVKSLNVISVPTMILSADLNRSSILVETTSGEGVYCSQDDSAVVSEVFPVNASMSLVSPTSPLYCRSLKSAVVQVTIETNPARSFTKIVKNIGTVSYTVLPSNLRRVRAAIIQVSGNQVSCSYECPATTSNAIPLVSNWVNEFKGVKNICCLTASGNGDISVTSESDE